YRSKTLLFGHSRRAQPEQPHRYHRLRSFLYRGRSWLNLHQAQRNHSRPECDFWYLCRRPRKHMRIRPYQSSAGPRHKIDRFGGFSQGL
ncbi:hypothetical protein LTS06_012410, partial [Exophiala xenobiotica]